MLQNAGGQDANRASYLALVQQIRVQRRKLHVVLRKSTFAAVVIRNISDDSILRTTHQEEASQIPPQVVL